MIITYLLLSSLKTIVTIQASKWLLIKLCMGEDAGLLLGWFEVGEEELIGPYLFHQDMEKVKVIQEGLKTEESRQNFYTYVRRRSLEFEVDD